jgi:hypothetical protein
MDPLGFADNDNEFSELHGNSHGHSESGHLEEVEPMITIDSIKSETVEEEIFDIENEEEESYDISEHEEMSNISIDGNIC